MTDADLGLLRFHLKRDEGLRLHVYDDATGLPLKQGDVLKGVLTIGYGRAIGIAGITSLEADSMLSQDMDRHVSDLERAYPFVRELDSVRQVTLANLCFNLGIRKLSGFKKMWAALRARNFEKAASEMLDSRWAQQVGARATRLAEEMRSGEFK